MKRARDGEATKAAILEAAAEQFAARGYAGVSVDRVAKAAGVQRSLLLYHFGSKPNLWAAVAEARLGRYLAHLDEEVDRLPDEDLLPTLAQRHFHFLQENPDLVRLTLWHKLEGVFARLDAGTGANAAGSRVLERVRERLASQQKAGRIRADLDPAHLVVAVLGLVEYWFQSQDMLAALGGAGGGREATAYLKDVTRLLARGLDPGPR